eukprot:gene9302-12533_t
MSVDYPLIPPLRYGVINPGVHRGCYPTLRHFRFLSRLQLRTIISLTPEPPSADLESFAELAGVKLLHFQIHRLVVLTDSLQSTLYSVVQQCIEANNLPIYIHCLDGRRITSLLVLMLRRLQGWTPVYSLSEYWRYQIVARSPLPSSEIEKVTKDLEKFVQDTSNIILPETIPRWLWEGDKSVYLNMNGLQ